MKSGLILLLTICSFGVSAQEPVYEMTKTDITKIDNFDGNNISFFGLQKGMTKKDAIDKLNNLKQFVWEYDGFNTKSKDPNSTDEMRIYVHFIDDNNGEKQLTLLYLLWQGGTTSMSSIVFYEDAGHYMTGDTKKLFSPEALKPGIPLTKFLKGSPKKTGNLTTNWEYNAQHFAFVDYINTEKHREVWFKFMD